MLPPRTQLVRRLIKRRVLLKLGQRQVARELRCSQPYLAQLERGRRPVSQDVARRLETIYKARPGSYSKGIFPKRGRPALEHETRRALNEIKRARGAEPRPLPLLGIPKYPRPDRTTGVDNPLWPIAVHLG